MLQRIRCPSPALVVALIALFAAISGAAIALPGKKSVDKNDLRKNVVKSKNVVNDSLTGNDIKESTLNLAQTPSPQVGAFAKVSGTGAVQASSGVTSVKRVGTGQYCFDLASPATAGTATPANAGVPFGTDAFVDIPAASPPCTGPNTDAEVTTGTTGFTDTPFYAVFVK